MHKKIIAIILLLTIMVLNLNNVKVNAANLSSLRTTNKFFNVSEDITFDTIFNDCIVTDASGKRLNYKNTNLSIVKVVSQNKTTKTVYDNSTGIAQSKIKDYIIPIKGVTYIVTANVTINNINHKSTFEIYFWDYEASYKYIRGIDLDNLNSLSPISKWTTGTLAATLRQSLYKTQPDEAIYRYTLSSKDINNIKSFYENYDYNWSSLKTSVKNIIKAIKFPTDYMKDHNAY